MRNFISLSLLILSGLLSCSLLVRLTHAHECTDWKQNHPDWLWCDSFEADTSLNSRYEDTNAQGMATTRETAYDGQQSLAQRYKTGQRDAGWIVKVNHQGFPDRLFFRFYHKYGPGYDKSFPQKMARIGFRRRFGDWKEVMRVHLWSDVTNGEPTLDVLARNSTRGPWLPVARSGVTFNEGLDQWTAFEVEVQLNTPGKSDGHYRLFINNLLRVERTEIDLRGDSTDPINEVMLDTYWNETAPANLARYYDNFVISTRKIGLHESEQASK